MWLTAMAILPVFVAFVALVSSAPTATPNPTNFYLVTTSQQESSSNSSHLANVNATSLFNPSANPFEDGKYLLRLISDDYNSLPTFNLTDGALHTLTYGVGAIGS